MNKIIIIIENIGGGVIFISRLLVYSFRGKGGFKRSLEQAWIVFYRSFLITAVAGFFVGAVTSVQFSIQSKGFGALAYLGGLATSGTIREVGPFLMAFMLSGKIGAFTSAEIGTMKVTDQIDAMKCMGVDPISEFVLPRFNGIIISGFLLLLIGLFMSIFGGMLLGVFFAKISPEEYIRHIPYIVKLSSIVSGVIKSFIFSIIIGGISTYQGYTTGEGARGVGNSVVTTAVASMFWIVIFDWLSSYMFKTVMDIINGY